MQQTISNEPVFPAIQFQQVQSLLCQCINPATGQPPRIASCWVGSKKAGFKIRVYFEGPHKVANAIDPDPDRAVQLFRKKLIGFNLIPAQA